MCRLVPAVATLWVAGFVGVGCADDATQVDPNKIGVVFAVHGGMETHTEQGLWDNAVQMFAHNPNDVVYRSVIWNPSNWHSVLAVGPALKSRLKYAFEYQKLGGTDPFTRLTHQQLERLEGALAALGVEHGKTFEVELAGWMAVGDDIGTYPHPRAIYTSPLGNGATCTYCGENEPGGGWPGCDPNRYDVDGPFERLLARGVSEIYVLDLTVGGPRFSKTFDLVRMGRNVVAAWNARRGSSVALRWLNDPTNLMERSYPSAPDGWTATLGAPEIDLEAPFEEAPNPLLTLPELAAAHADAIERAFSPSIGPEATAVLLLNHALVDNNECFDPKVDDTLVLNEAIRAELQARHPTLPDAHILGGVMGVRELNPENGMVELSRAMRGEDLGHFYLYESAKSMPSGRWSHRYWDALEMLKGLGVRHIAIAFPQIVTDSALNLVEVPNQIAKEIGTRTWLPQPHATRYYSNADTPFADYWGVWSRSECDGGECCFVMGGCGDKRPYPPPRQTGASAMMSLDDPSLVFDVSEYGHLGYEPDLGPPDAEAPVQGQYTGTWSVAPAINDDAEVFDVLAAAIADALAAQLSRADTAPRLDE